MSGDLFGVVFGLMLQIAVAAIAWRGLYVAEPALRAPPGAQLSLSEKWGFLAAFVAMTYPIDALAGLAYAALLQQLYAIGFFTSPINGPEVTILFWSAVLAPPTSWIVSYRITKFGVTRYAAQRDAAP